MSSAQENQRRLWWHGMALFILGLLTGAAIPLLTNSRMGLSAHLAGVQNGIVVLVFGVLWPHLQLTAGQESIARWSGLIGMYGVWAALLVAALLGTSRSTPIAGAGYRGTPTQEVGVTAVIAVSSLAIFVASGLVLYGLRGRPKQGPPN